MVAALNASGAEESCYRLSRDGHSWSRTPELLCIKSMDGEDQKFEITLKSGLPGNQEVFATFNYGLISRARCPEHNQDVYGVLNPENSIFNMLSIQFGGERQLRSGTESGTIKIGTVTFNYKK